MSEILKSDVFKHKDDKEILTYMKIHYYCMTKFRRTFDEYEPSKIT